MQSFDDLAFRDGFTSADNITVGRMFPDQPAAFLRGKDGGREDAFSAAGKILTFFQRKRCPDLFRLVFGDRRGRRKTGRFDAGSIVKDAAALCGGKGGGKKDMAQSGGSNTGNMQDIIDSVRKLLA